VGVTLLAAAHRPTRDSSASAEHGLRLGLLDSFELVLDGTRIELPMSVQRVVAFVALKRHPVLRPHAAGSLWPDSSEPRAAASLRSALWRLKRSKCEVIDASGARLRLADDVSVDLYDASELARDVLAGVECDVRDPAPLAAELLPDWYDDWVLVEREHFRQVRLRALETLCERFMDARRLDEALAMGFAALKGEPLRESAHRALIRLYLLQGNVCEAIRQYRLCCRLLRPLGVEPSEQITALVRGIDDRETGG
jgi:DNA-binding SARP family transcriptional activator